VFEILHSKRIGSRVWPFRVTWRYRSRDFWYHIGPFPIVSFGTMPLSLTVSELFNVEWPRPLNKGQGHSFWYESISHIRLPICCQW